MRILVTGGAGFIGSHLCEKLLKDGHVVHAIDTFATGAIDNLATATKHKNFFFQQESILDLKAMRVAISKSDYVFHLAASVGVFNIVNNPLESLITNIRGTENILECASEFGVPVFLTSSSEVYGKNKANSLRETDDRIVGDPTVLRWSYSEAKAIDESMAYAYFTERKLPVRIVRFFNTVGPRQLGAYGMVVPRFVRSALLDQDVTIYGDGKQTRCFAHIYDVIEAVISVAFTDNTLGRVVNVGNDFEISILDLAKKVIADTGSSSRIVFVPYSDAYGEGFEDMERRVPNIELIKNLVGWSPKLDLTSIISDIASEMRKTLI
jgi:UDP-glucose 4-epimerase